MKPETWRRVKAWRRWWAWRGRRWPAGARTPSSRDESSSYVIIQSLQAASGALPSEFSGTLASDVVTLVKKDVNGEQSSSRRCRDLSEATFASA